MNRLFFLIALLSLIIISCEEEDFDNNDNPKGFLIKTGMICGWCAGGDTLQIDSNNLVYKFVSPCDDNVYEKDRIFSQDELDNLLQNFNLDEFLSIDINTCNVCVDGCDKWIYFQNDTTSHLIRFGLNDSLEIENIKIFVNKLDAIRLKIKNEFN